MTDHTALYQTADYRALYAGVLAHPDADLPRLVLADWLQEHGDDDRAEFIRLDCEPRPHAPDVRHERGCGWCVGRERCESLINRHADEWFSPPGGVHVTVDPADRFVSGHWMIVGKGFVAEVLCPLAWWVGDPEKCPHCDPFADLPMTHERRNCPGTPAYGPAVVAAHPVKRVTITDREPWYHSTSPFHCWWKDSIWGSPEEDADQVGNLPDDVFDRIAEMHPDSRLYGSGRAIYMHLAFATRDAAMSALSAACIDLAKRPAGTRIP